MRFKTVMMRSFCWGVTRQNRRVLAMRPLRASSLSVANSGPLMISPGSNLRVAHTCRATCSLSPVSTFTAIPDWASALRAAAADAFGGIQKHGEPGEGQFVFIRQIDFRLIPWLGSTGDAQEPEALVAEVQEERLQPFPPLVRQQLTVAARAFRVGGQPHDIFRRALHDQGPSSIQFEKTETRRRSKSNGTSSILRQGEASISVWARIASSSGLFRPLSKWLFSHARDRTRSLS